MTELNCQDRAVLYQEFKEWIVNAGEAQQSQDVLCLRYLNNDRKIN